MYKINFANKERLTVALLLAAMGVSFTYQHAFRSAKASVITPPFLPLAPDSTQVHFGMCDASAAIAMKASTFLVANDEDNLLRLYPANQTGPALRNVNLENFLKIDLSKPKRREADLEGAARLGDNVFWIASHSRNKDGEPRPNRLR